MPSSRQRNLGEERRWRALLADWSRSGFSGAEYCQRNEIRYTLFADWKRKIKRRDAEASDGEGKGKASRHQIGSRAKQRAQSRHAGSEQPHGVEFAEVRVVERQEQPPVQQSRTRITVPLEIVLPSGTLVRVAEDCPLQLLSSVVSLLENR